MKPGATPRVVFRTLDSTMEEARRRWAMGERGPLWIVADEQTGGRGRHGRGWVSPPGNLHATLMLPAPCAPHHQPKLGFAVGVVLADAARCLLPQAVVTLKWPNDLMLGGAKAAGLLLEALGAGEGIAVGLGINLRHHPDLPAYRTTAFAEHVTSGSPPSPETVLASLDAGLAEILAVFGDGAGFPAIRDRWLAMAHGLGAAVAIRQEGGTMTGIAHGLDGEGRLLVAFGGRLVPVAAGDVFPLDKA